MWRANIEYYESKRYSTRVLIAMNVYYTCKLIEV